MRDLMAIDVGGTSIKLAVWHDGKLVDEHSVPTPDSLDGYYEALESEVASAREGYPIEGVAMSSPGAPNSQTGVIESSSAIPYIHGFDIRDELARRFCLPVSIENDANCAALAEVADGVGKDATSLLFVVIGTGVGGAVIIDRKLWHGAHLLGGEFGFAITKDGRILSEVASPVSMAARYKERTGHEVTGKEVFDLAEEGDDVAADEVHTMTSTLARALFNLQYCFDPQMIVLGGGISNNPHLIPLLEAEVKDLQATLPFKTIAPTLVTCAYTSAANLRGAVENFEQTYSEVG
ncbi:MAG: ROK family protein [Atopobiaceae bacterium]|nr:ROK family protein [Atopobiaceae bacterium]MCH4180150.1 ROK family protein [Atopobiaceae bacterium]MCH4214320.1 ROK family protein [Atopobiaceae bacterium]MCH4230642.1 ROK family protein [Atopobiaceae bacterium]MCH4276620.1 ROK family protein [Atopobiaceae bacterium]